MAKWDLDKLGEDRIEVRYVIEKVDAILIDYDIEKALEDFKLELVRHLSGNQFQSYLKERLKDV